MLIVDSCGWLEWFCDGELADEYEKYLSEGENIIVPAIVLYEVYKVLKRNAGEEKALQAVGFMKNHKVEPIDEILALSAADIALENNLAMADAIVVAVSRLYNCPIFTSDADFKDISNATVIQKH